MTQRRSKQGGSTASSHSRSQSNSHSHTHSFSTVTSTKHSSGHATSSAFSASANPDEDWTKIPDLAERRRIQNRIAQRNYRKKLKKKLEDLEARAASAPPSPPELHQELEGANGKTIEAGLNHGYAQSFGSSESGSRYISPELLSTNGYFTEELPEDEHRRILLTEPAYASDVSSTSPQPPYWQFIAQDPAIYPAASDAGAGYGALPTSSQPAISMPYLHAMPVPTTAPMKSGTMGGDQPAMYAPHHDLLQPYGLNDEVMASMSMQYAHMDPESNHQTPLLSDSFDVSLAGSPANSTGTFPLTPVLFPASPLHL